MKFFLLFLICSIAATYAQTNGVISDAVIIPPNYTTFAPPANIGGTYLDPAFGTRIQRITNCNRFEQDCLGGYFGNSEICYFNCDGSYFIAAENELINDDNLIGTFLYNGITGARLKLLGLYGATLQPYYLRWALADKYKKDGKHFSFDPVYSFYYLAQNEIRLYDVRDIDNFIVLHTFHEYENIGPAGGEGDVSDDGRFLCLDGDARELFVYDLIDDVKYPVSAFDLGSLGSKGGQVGVDYASVSSRGTFVIVSWGTDPLLGEQYHGIEVYDKNWNYQRQIYPGIIHWEVGTDAFGDEVIYTAAPFGFTEYYKQFGINPGDIISIRISDGRLRLLKHIPKWAHFSMSACNSVSDGSYLYVSYLCRSDDPGVLWYPFWGEIIEVPTNGSGEIRRLLHHRTRNVSGKTDKYWQADLTVNRQGTKIIYRSVYLSRIGDIYMFDVGSRHDSESDNTPPLPPSGLSNPIQNYDQLELKWDPPAQASDGDYASFYKIYRDNTFITECIDTRYRDVGLQEATTYRYDVYSVDNAGLVSATAAPAFFTTLSDTSRPKLSLVRIEGRSRLKLFFSEPIDPQTAQSADHYQLDVGAQVFSAALLSDQKTVLLEISPLELGAPYHLSVRNIRDASVKKNLILPGAEKTIRIYADLFDDFENGISDSWFFHLRSRWDCVAEESDQSLYLNSGDYQDENNQLLGEYAIITDQKLITNKFRMSVLAKSAENTVTNPDADCALVFGYRDSQNYCYVQFHSFNIVVNRIEDGKKTFIEKYLYNLNLSQYQQLQLDLEYDTLKVKVNENQVLTKYFRLPEAGKIGIGSYNDAVYFDNLMIEVPVMSDSVPPLEPTDLRLVVRTSTSLTIEWTPSLPASDGEAAAYYEVYRNSQFIKTTTSSRFVDVGLESKSNYTYQVYAIDDDGLKSIRAVTGSFSTQVDVQAPHIVFARPVNQFEVHIYFSEKIKSNAENIENYQIDHQIKVEGASLWPDEMTVLLQVQELKPSVEYLLYVQNITDLVGNKIDPNTVISFRLLPDFFDDFEHGISSDWYFRNRSRWSLSQNGTNHLLFLNTSDYESPSDRLLGEYALVGRQKLQARYFRLYCQVQSAEDPIKNLQADYAFIFGYTDSLNYYFVQFHPYNIGINRITNGVRTFFQQYPFTIPFNQIQQISLETGQDSLRVFIDERMMVAQALAEVPAGQIGLGSYNDSAYFDNLWIKDIEQTDIIPPSPPAGLQLLLMKQP